MTTTSAAHAQSSDLSVRALAAIIFVFGAGLVFMTGFAPAATLHNAAHDSRHAMGFPCH